MNARITLIGIENILNKMYDESITDTWTVTDSESFDKDILLSTIIQKGGTFEPLYTDPVYFYSSCSWWWKKWNRTFNKWFYVFDQEYNPLWDRNGFEEVHEDTKDVLDNDKSFNTAGNRKEIIDDDTTGHISEVMDDDTTSNNREVIDDDSTSNNREVVDIDTTTSTREVMDDDTSTNEHTVTENTVSAFDSNTYQPHDKSDVTGNSTGTDDRTTTTTGSGTDDRTTVTTGSGTDDRTTVTTGSGTDDRTTVTDSTGTDDRTTTTTTGESGTSTDDSINDRDFDRVYHSWGNWGISMTSQKLLEQEIKVQYFNIYNHIADIFLDELTIKVY